MLCSNVVCYVMLCDVGCVIVLFFFQSVVSCKRSFAGLLSLRSVGAKSRKDLSLKLKKR